MAISYLYQPTQRIGEYQPISDELLYQGQKEIYNRGKDFATKVEGTYSDLFNIKTDGADTNKLAEIQEGVKEQIQKLSQQGFSSPEVQAQISSLINNVSNNKDVLTIHKRATMRDSELQKMEKSLEKGEEYVSPFLDYYQDYINSGIYSDKLGGMSQGWISPKDSEIAEKAKKIVEKKTEIIENPDGTRYSREYYDPIELSQAIKIVSESNPNYLKDRQYKFERNTKGTDWKEYSLKKYSPILKNAEQIKQKAYSLYNSTNDVSKKAYYLEQYNRATSLIDKYAPLIGNNVAIEEIKKEEFQSLLENERNKLVSTMDAVKQSNIAMNEVKKMNIDLNNEIYKKDREMVSKGAMLLGLDPDDVMESPELMKLAINTSQEFEMSTFKQKEDVKTANKITTSLQKSKQLSTISSGQELPYYDENGTKKTTTWGNISQATKDSKAANSNKRFVMNLINTLLISEGNSSLLSDPSKLIIKPNGEMLYDGSIIPFYGNINLGGLKDLANPQTYKNLDINFNSSGSSEGSQPQIKIARPK